ncbi:hypothetical protein DID88_008283 [Monilinia fructigena]|uniref:TIM-barrel domain-containing protein n=1 Tax=Monilinia fructigena TaxID=38457 RepID=A0A395J5W9_9HELO|nr:hypothetical protein DID88_008283 [Monilinia fructigena]
MTKATTRDVVLGKTEELSQEQEDHRRSRSRNWSLSQVRRSRWRRSHHHIQLRAFSHGRTRLTSRSYAIWRCQPGCCRNGLRDPPHSKRHGSARRGLRNRPFRNIPPSSPNLKTSDFAASKTSHTVGLIDGLFRENLEETGMGYDQEVEMIQLAHEQDLLTTLYIFNPEDAIKMTKAGADVLVAHMGLTTTGTIGAKTGSSLDECVKAIQDIRDAAVKVREDIIVLCHGGPVAEAKDVEYVLARTKGIHGFYGASSMERLPVEVAIRDNMKGFKELKVW